LMGRARLGFLLAGVIAAVLIGVLLSVSLTPSATISSPPSTGRISAYDQGWAKTELVDVLTGKRFRIADFEGKTVFVELMAIWCPACTRQQFELSRLINFYGLGGKIIIVSVDIDPNESAGDLAKYARSQGYDWHWAVDPSGLFNNFFKRSPPETPVIVIAPDGTFTIFSGRVTKAPEFLSHLEGLGVKP
jgi:thiol-disulfide isomerase/thioredoxin